MLLDIFLFAGGVSLGTGIHTAIGVRMNEVAGVKKTVRIRPGVEARNFVNEMVRHFTPVNVVPSWTWGEDSENKTSTS